MHSALRLWISFFVFILFVAASFSQQSASDCQRPSFILFIWYCYIGLAILCFFLCNFQFSVFIGRFASKFISEIKKKKFCVFLYIWVFAFWELVYICLLILRSNFKFLRVWPLSKLLSALELKSNGAWFKITPLPTPDLVIYLFTLVCYGHVSLSPPLYFDISMELEARLCTY